MNFYPDNPDLNRVARSPRTTLARELAVTAQGTDPTEGDFHPLDPYGRGRFTQTFVPAEVGMVAHMRCCYFNTAGRGPYSPVLSTPIIGS